MKLKKLGKGFPAKSGNIIIQLNVKNLPKIGDKVVNRNLLKVGFVYDIIGPVNSPFAVIRPESKDVVEKVIFDELFVVMSYGGNRKGKRGRKKGERKGKGSRKKGNRKRRYA